MPATWRGGGPEILSAGMSSGRGGGQRRIISASRRTDIPAFFGEWLVDSLKRGRAGVVHPYTRSRQEVPLSPEHVYAIVLWSKDFAPFMGHLDELDRLGYNLYFLYTITAMGGSYEPRVPDVACAVEVFRRLSRRYSPRHVQWRFDPILLTEETDPQFYLTKFREIAARLSGVTTRCYISFAYPYPKALTRFRARFGDRLTWLTPEEGVKRDLAGAIAAAAREYGIDVYSCCDRSIVGDGVEAGSCIDYPYLEKLFGPLQPQPKKAPTRPGCNCYESIDIGAYNTCSHGCVYCYANR